MGKIEEWLQKDKLILLEGWARSGLTEEQIAKNMGITRPTLWDWKKKEINILNALKKGKEVVDFEVENALLKRALGYTITLNKQKVTKDGDVVDIIEEVHVPGDTTAQIFWLKNRQKEKWREKQEVSVSSNPIEDLTPLAKLLKGEKNESSSNN